MPAGVKRHGNLPLAKGLDSIVPALPLHTHLNSGGKLSDILVTKKKGIPSNMYMYQNNVQTMQEEEKLWYLHGYMWNAWLFRVPEN